MYKFILIQDGEVYDKYNNIFDLDNALRYIIMDNDILSFEQTKFHSLINLILIVVDNLDFDFIIKKED